MLYKKGVFKISQNSQENLECQSLFLLKLQTSVYNLY